MEVGFGGASCHPCVQASLAGGLEIMCELFWRVGYIQSLEKHGRCFLVVLRFSLYDIEDLVPSLARREGGDYVVGLDMCPFSIWCWHLVSGLGQISCESDRSDDGSVRCSIDESASDMHDT